MKRLAFIALVLGACGDLTAAPGAQFECHGDADCPPAQSCLDGYCSGSTVGPGDSSGTTSSGGSTSGGGTTSGGGGTSGGGALSSGGTGRAGAGAPCENNGSCASGLCLGHCCNAACLTTPPCGATSCDETGACAYPSTQCAPESCTAGTQTSSATCYEGLCPPAVHTPCAPYACGLTACMTDCTLDLQCAPGNQCKKGLCGP